MPEEDLQLNLETLAALREFQQEKQEQLERFNRLQTAAEMDFANMQMSKDFPEDWQLSQFWYSRETSDALADMAIACQDSGDLRIACIACPSSFLALQRKIKNRPITLFEYDTRFSVFGKSFVKYDYADPLNLEESLLGTFNVILAGSYSNSNLYNLSDPPFLSEECFEKTAQTILALASADADCKIIVCTGRVQLDIVQRSLPQMKMASFQPQHENGLSNDFICITNFEEKTDGH